MILIATLTVRPGALDAFRDYERKAAAIMERHGGRIERAVTLRPDPGDGALREVHLVRFPDVAALEAYRDDADFKALAALRESCIGATAIWYGEPGPEYHE
jgi:uncharacterized protein (DUF1330 family)